MKAIPSCPKYIGIERSNFRCSVVLWSEEKGQTKSKL